MEEENKVVSPEEVYETMQKLNEAANTAKDMDLKAEKEDQLSDDQIKKAFEDANNFIENLKEEVGEDTGVYSNIIPLNITDVEKKDMTVVTNPETGEQKVVGISDLNVPTFEDIVSGIDSGEYDIDDEEDKPLTEEDIMNNINESDEMGDSEIGSYLKENDVTPEEVVQLLQIINNKNHGENVNMYKSLPEKIQKVIDKYVKDGCAGQGYTALQMNTIRNSVAESLMEEFESSIRLKQIKRDFAQDMEKIYSESTKELSESSINYIEERNKIYRENANEIEDPEKRKKLIDILDQIDEARALSTLKEFSKKCKIKHIDLEKPEKWFGSFLDKYKNSNNNIYDISVVKHALIRNIVDPSSGEYLPRDIDGFLIAFVKQTANYKPSNALEHAYMYYVMYYCALLDGDKSDVFKNNIKEVIQNLRERNGWKS